MKKFISTTLIVLLLVQSFSPTTYAANKESGDDTRPGATQNPGKPVNNMPSFVLEYKNADLSNVGAIGVVQVAAVGYAYKNGGIIINNDDANVDPVIINNFLDMYAIHLGFRLGDDLTNDQEEQLADDWMMQYSEEYNKVYNYAKDRQGEKVAVPVTPGAGDQNTRPQDPNQAPGGQNQAPGGQNQAPGNSKKSPVDEFAIADLGSIKTIEILQIAAMGYAYDKAGELVFKDGDQMAALVNEFIEKYLPHLGFRLKDGTSDDQQLVLVDTRRNTYPKEYDAVYSYAKDRQDRYNAQKPNTGQGKPVDGPTSNTKGCVLSKQDEQNILESKIAYEKLIKEKKSGEAAAMFKKIESISNKCTNNTTSSVVQLQQECSLTYTKLMAEYNRLSTVNAPIEEINAIKQKIDAAADGKNCVISKPVEQTEKQHNSLVAKVKEALNFGKNTSSIIPQNIIPNYCEVDVVNGLKEQLDANDINELNEIKQRIQDILTDENIKNNQNKKSIMQFALSTATTVETEKILTSDSNKKEESAADNFVRNLAILGDTIINGKGMKIILGFLDNNLETASTMINALEDMPGFDSFASVLQKGGSAYIRDGKEFVNNKNTTSQDDITFAFPANKDTKNNNGLITLRSVQTHTYEKLVDYKSYDATNPTGRDISTATGFGQVARDNGSVWGMGVPVVSLPKNIIDTLKKDNSSWYQDIAGTQYEYINFPVAQIGMIRKAYIDKDLTTYMPAGDYETNWSRYNVNNEGVLTEYDVNEIPVKFVAKAEVDNTLFAAVEGELTWADDTELAKTKDVLPLTVKAKIYIADFLFDIQIQRQQVEGSRWKMSLHFAIQGPSICTFAIDGELYINNGSLGGIDLDVENITDGHARFVYNKDIIELDVQDIAEMMQTIKNNPTIKKEGLKAYTDIVKNYITANYSFDQRKIADIVVDANDLVQMQYVDGSSESAKNLIMRYAGLINTDYMMRVLQPLFDDGGKEGGQSLPSRPELSIASKNDDGQNITLSYNFGDKFQKNLQPVQPNVSLVALIKDQNCADAFCSTIQTPVTRDGTYYVVGYNTIPNDETVQAVYTLAEYTDYTTPKSQIYTLRDYIVQNNGIRGCTDTMAYNYNPDANNDDKSCLFKDINTPKPGEDTPKPKEKNPKPGEEGPNQAPKENDGLGCMDMGAINYDPMAAMDDGSCQYSGSTAPTPGYNSGYYDSGYYNSGYYNSGYTIPTLDFTYTAITANDPMQFALGYTLSTDTKTLVSPDNVQMQIWYLDGANSNISLTQSSDALYRGDNSFVNNPTIKSVSILANIMINGELISTTSWLK